MSGPPLLASLIWVTIGPPLMALLCQHISIEGRWEQTWAATGGLLTALYLAVPEPVPLVAAANAAIGLVLWWWNRRKPLRALRAIGAKARALIAGLVRRVREAGGRRRVLRPAPGGAR